MIEAHEVHDGSVEIVDMDGVAHDVVAKLVGFTIDCTRFDTAAHHKCTIRPWVVVAAIIIFGGVALSVVGTAKFAAPDDQRFVQKTALFEVGDALW